VREQAGSEREKKKGDGEGDRERGREERKGYGLTCDVMLGLCNIGEVRR
jgi:hypothetical protein